MKLIDYIKTCLKDSKFKEYWLEDNLPLFESYSNSSTFIEAYKQLSDLFESSTEYKDKLDLLLKDKGIKVPNNGAMTIEFYEYNNNCPVKDFLESILDPKLKEKTVKNIFNLSEFNINLKGTELSKHIKDGIFELRTKQGSNIDRIFYFFCFGNKIVLTNGYIKKSQKMADKEFEKAKQYMNEYLSRS